MSSYFGIRDFLPEEVICMLKESDSENIGIAVLFMHILEACRNIGVTIRAGEYSSHRVGTSNAFGDHQLGCISHMKLT